MPAFRSVVSVLVRFVGRTFSTPSRPALRAAACGGRPRPAALAGSGPDFPPQPNHRHFNPEVRSSKNSAQKYQTSQILRPRKYLHTTHTHSSKGPNKQITTPLPPQLRGLYAYLGCRGVYHSPEN
jgi:hypothetical protein